MIEIILAIVIVALIVAVGVISAINYSRSPFFPPDQPPPPPRRRNPTRTGFPGHGYQPDPPPAGSGEPNQPPRAP